MPSRVKVFMDRTWCPFCGSCELGLQCHNALVIDVWEAADKHGTPLKQFESRPSCWVERDFSAV